MHPRMIFDTLIPEVPRRAAWQQFNNREGWRGEDNNHKAYYVSDLRALEAEAASGKISRRVDYESEVRGFFSLVVIFFVRLTTSVGVGSLCVVCHLCYDASVRNFHPLNVFVYSRILSRLQLGPIRRPFQTRTLSSALRTHTCHAQRRPTSNIGVPAIAADGQQHREPPLPLGK